MTAGGGWKGLFRSWPALPGALASALIGQFLLLSGRLEAGVVFYLAAAVLVLVAPEGGREAAQGDLSPAKRAVALVAIVSEFFFPAFIVPGDAAATARNITAAEPFPLPTAMSKVTGGWWQTPSGQRNRAGQGAVLSRRLRWTTNG